MSKPSSLPQLTQEDYETRFAGRHRLHDVVRYWAERRPDAPALITSETGRPVNWMEFERYTMALAGTFKKLGIAKGDFVATLLPMTAEHVQLEYACFRLGAIVAPLDLRLTEEEMLRAIEQLRPKALFGLGVKGALDLRPLWNTLRERCPWLGIRVVADSSEAVEQTRNYHAFYYYAWRSAMTHTTLESFDAEVDKNDAAMAIYTPGPAASRKAVLLSHRNITAQNMCLSGAFLGGDQGARALVNLPASHAGGQTALLMSTLFGGGAAILVDRFDAARSLQAAVDYQAEILGQTPAMFHEEWTLEDYPNYDLSSLRFAVYGGRADSKAFLEKLQAMAPAAGAGMRFVETAGFCTYLPCNGQDEEAPGGGLGLDMPAYPCTIREPMRADGEAGAELPPGATGEICFRGLQTFLGYVNDEEATQRRISRDGYFYTGDRGFKDQTGLYAAAIGR